MSFISYSQNFEDLMLWRALNHIEIGFYIDVGANDPEIESVTKAFYDSGWHGINIEPVLSHYEALLEKRPKDINLKCAVGDTRGEIDIFECNVRGWATGVQNIADKYIEKGYQGEFHRVPLRTLSDICAEFVSGAIHFLKIDVEGFEKEVIFGADFKKFRPWIVVVEATIPNSIEEVHGEWEPILFDADYLFAYADGLNRFYVAKENSKLISSFRYPPNVFDEFIRIDQLNLEIKARNLDDKARYFEDRAIQAEATSQEATMRSLLAETRVKELESRIKQTETTVQDVTMRAEQAEAIAHESTFRAEQAERICNLICSSYSWKITAPLRWAGNFARRLVKVSKNWACLAPGSLLRRIIKSIVIHLRLKI